MAQRRTDIDDKAEEILGQLAHKTYEQLALEYGTSRGKIYALAMKYGRRVNEAKLQERAAERKRRQAQFLQEVMNTTQTADVLDYLDGLPDESVDMFLTSPKYNAGKPYGGSKTVDRWSHHFYLGWLLQVTAEMSRVLAPGGVIFLQVGQTSLDDGSLYPIDVMLFNYLREMGLSYQSRIVWTIGHGLTPKRRLAERYETVLVFSKGEPTAFNANAARIPQKEPGKRAFKGPNKGQLSGHPLGAWPTNVWHIPAIGANNGEKTDHCAQFPLALVKRAVLLYTQPGQTVCDPFNGSGTTQVGALETGRAFTGCDLFYAETRAKRLASASPDLLCDLPGVTDELLSVRQREAGAVHISAPPISDQENEQMLLDMVETVA